jgi:hypothetical protein
MHSQNVGEIDHWLTGPNWELISCPRVEVVDVVIMETID